MIDLLELITGYLADKLTLTAGKQIFYNEMPAEPAKCVLIQEVQTNISVPAQIDAEIHKIHVTARDASNTTAAALAGLCWRWLFTDVAAPIVTPERYELADTAGVIHLLPYVTVQVSLYGNPVWLKADQQGRKYYDFYATVITKR